MAHRSHRGVRTAAPGRRGLVLVLVLVVLGLVAGLVIEAQVIADATQRLEERRFRASELRAALAETARLALQRLANDDLPDVDHLEEDWGAPLEIEYPSGISAWARVTDENRYFDLNNLYIEAESGSWRPADEIVMDLLTLCGDFTPIDRVDALRDWIDPDEDGFRETPYYRDQDVPYDCADRWLSTWEELFHVAGFSREYFKRHERYSSREAFRADVVDCITVIPGRRSQPVPVNVNTAPREVLLGIIGLDQESLVEYILVLREERPLVSLDAFAAAADPIRLESVRPYLEVRSGTFRLTARAFAEGQSAEVRVLARRDSEGNVHVLQWVF